VITGIIIALPNELTTLTSKRIDRGHCVFIADKILVAYSGAGATNAQISAELLISKGTNQLISWGCAAALDGTLKPGDLVIADRLITRDDEYIEVNKRWHAHAHSLLSPLLTTFIGGLTESASIVSSNKEKQHLHTITQAIALDMESAAIAKTAQEKNLPFLTIRVIVDPATMNMPAAINYAINDHGEISLKKLALFIALHPNELIDLIRLGFYFNAAKSSLKQVAKKIDALSHFQ
jgi:adenosylhomocysteine nucleosidase